MSACHCIMIVSIFHTNPCICCTFWKWQTLVEIIKILKMCHIFCLIFLKYLLIVDYALLILDATIAWFRHIFWSQRKIVYLDISITVYEKFHFHDAKKGGIEKTAYFQHCHRLFGALLSICLYSPAMYLKIMCSLVHHTFYLYQKFSIIWGNFW